MAIADSNAADGCLWYAQGPAAAFPPLQGELGTDALVVGAGYCGLAAAALLQSKGLKTTIIDAREIGGGASGRNGGQLVPGFKVGPRELVRRFGASDGTWLFEFGQRAAELVEALVAEHGIDCDLQRNGWVKAAHSNAARAKLEVECDELQRAGANARLLDRDQLSELIGDSSYRAGMLLGRGGTLNPYAYCIGLARAVIRKGGTVYGRTPAQSIESDGEGWRVRVPGATIRATTVAVATDGYTDGLLNALSRSIIRVGSVQVATEPLSPAVLQRLVRPGVGVSDTRVLLRYFRISPDGRLVVGGRGAFSDRSDPSLFDSIERSIAQIYPGVDVGTIARRWHGMVALTPDSLPHIVCLGDRLFFAGGFNGRGVAMATVFGQTLASVMTGGDRDHPLVQNQINNFSFHPLRAPIMSLGARVLGLRDWMSS